MKRLAVRARLVRRGADDVRAEESSAAGRADMVVALEDAVWLLELKIDERASPGAVLAQLRERGYGDMHRRRVPRSPFCPLVPLSHEDARVAWSIRTRPTVSGWSAKLASEPVGLSELYEFGVIGAVTQLSSCPRSHFDPPRAGVPLALVPAAHLHHLQVLADGAI